jgi:hypothetical protein
VSGGEIGGGELSGAAAHEETDEDAEMEGDTGDMGMGIEAGERGRGNGDETRRIGWGRGGVWLTRLIVPTACLYAWIMARHAPDSAWMAESMTTISVWNEKADTGGDDGRDYRYALSCEKPGTLGTTHLCEDVVLLVEEIEDDLLDKPGLCYLWDDVLEEDLEDYFANDKALGLRSIVLLRETRLEDMIDYLAYVLWVDGAIRGNCHVGLKTVEEDGKGKCGTAGVRSGELGSSVTVIAVVLGDDRRDVAENEGGKICVLYACLEGTDDMGEDAGNVWEKLFVVTGDLGPPGVNEGAQSKGDKVIDLCGELRGGCRICKERG